MESEVLYLGAFVITVGFTISIAAYGVYQHFYMSYPSKPY